MRPALYFIGALFVFAASFHGAAAQSPQFVPAYPLYCQGPLTTGVPSSGETTTPFQWASVGAGAANPAPGQCVWADRGPRGSEIQSGGGNLICDWSSAMQSVPAGAFVEVGVARDPLVGNCMHLFRYLGSQTPPFSGVPFLQPFTRPSIASLTADQINALRAGIQVMMNRPVTDPTSYRFQANIHGTEDPATTTEEMQSWDQCEHGSFYFPSWHRMYLYFFDRILRAAAASAGYQNVVLPYWDWTDPAQRALPLPFRQPSTPATTTASASWTTGGNTISVTSTSGIQPGFTIVDASNSNAFVGTVSSAAGTTVTLNANAVAAGASGDSLAFANPLYIVASLTPGVGRPPDVDDGTFNLLASAVDDSGALADVDFDTGGSLGNGFGSGPASPMQFNSSTGDLENQPHNIVHSDLGGLMGVIDTAAQDPIFWLHHANIDRLWNKWIEEGGGRTDPSDAAWLNTTFTFYDEAGHAVYLTGAEVVDTVGQLNYRYDDDPPAPGFIKFPIILTENALRGAEQRLALGPSPVVVRLPIDEQAREALTTLARQPGRRVFLRIQDIRTEKPPGYHYAIYLNPPAEQKVNEQTPGFVGNLSLFSMAPHRMPNGMAMPRQEMSVNYDISRLVSELPRDSKELSVVLVPQRGLVNGEPAPIPQETAGTVGSLQLIER